MHLTKNCKNWDSFPHELFTTGGMKSYAEVNGETLKGRFFSTMIDEVSKRHGVEDYATGFEAHPDITPYDRMMLKMVKEIKDQEAKENAEKGRKAHKHRTMLTHESNICMPIVNRTIPTNAHSWEWSD